MPERPIPAWWREHAERLGLRKVGGELVGPCPNCGTGDNRFAVRLSDGLINCRQCGAFKRILRAAGWDKEGHEFLDLKVSRKKTRAVVVNDRMTREWEYVTVKGEKVCIKRTDRTNQPKIIERSPKGITGPYMPLIREPYSGYEGPLVIVEGEIAADAVIEAGYKACCWINGSAAVGQTDWSELKGMDIVLWPDADDQGLTAMDRLAQTLRIQDCSIRVVDISDMGHGLDAVDVEKEDRPEMIEDAMPYRTPVPKGASELRVFMFDRSVRPPEQILPGYIERSAVSVIAGRGGTAKSVRLVIETLAMISGQDNIADVEPTLAYKVAHLGVEEDPSIFMGRMIAAADYYGVPEDVVTKRLLVWEDGWYAKFGGEQGNHLIDWMAERLLDAHVDVLTADPFSFLVEGEADNNSMMVIAMQQLIELAKKAKIGIRIVHHAGKGKDGNPSY